MSARSRATSCDKWEFASCARLIDRVRADVRALMPAICRGAVRLWGFTQGGFIRDRFFLLAFYRGSHGVYLLLKSSAIN